MSYNSDIESSWWFEKELSLELSVIDCKVIDVVAEVLEHAKDDCEDSSLVEDAMSDDGCTCVLKAASGLFVFDLLRRE